MPDYRTDLKRGTLSITTAIRAGKRDIHRNAVLIAAAAAALGVLLGILGLGLWPIVICLSGGIVVDIIYVGRVVAAWRIWAYSGVADIHQFQRCAELENLLPRNSFAKNIGNMSAAQRARLAMLQARFNEDLPFLDDADVPQSVRIFERGVWAQDRSRPYMNISREGITVRQHGFAPWSEISNEHIGEKSASRGLLSGPSGSVCFCYIAAGIMFEIRMSRLAIGIAELDQILYIQRGRYENDRAGNPVVIPLHPSKHDIDP